MKKVILIDGNNLLFRSYYATAYNGKLMKNSKGFPTNALYGLVNMLNKIITEEQPTHIMVAFDKGRTFRHEKYQDYKGGRSETPTELKQQMPLARELVRSMGITSLEIDNYEADDIIGTFAATIDKSDDISGLIISSDKDLIQLISSKIDMKLLKSNDYILMNEEKFQELYGIDNPLRMIDLKALMGDASDNILGVRGIGEKTAISLISKYKTLDGVYENIDNISNATKQKLLTDKDSAYMSYDLATIYKEVPIDTNIDNLEYKGINKETYQELLKELEFYSLLKKMDYVSSSKDEKFIVINNLNDLKLDSEYSIYLETFGYNYHKDKPLGISITTKDNSYYIPFNLVENSSIFCDNKKKYTYDLKKLLYVFQRFNIKIDQNIDDLMLMLYLLNKNIKTDIASIANNYGYDIRFYEKIYGTELTLKEPIDDSYIKDIVLKSKFIYYQKDKLKDELLKENIKTYYENIELPLTYVLMKMEYNGFLVNKDYLNKFGEELDKKLKDISKKIFLISNLEFNILSPKQLSDVLFKNLNIPYPIKNTKGNLSTSKEILDKLKDKYEIVKLVLEYRAIAKIKSNYVTGIIMELDDDSKIHTIYNQTLTRTGRLSSERPNLQNIPIRDEVGKLIRLAFVGENDKKIASFDYSQIELRIFASLAKADDMIEAFKKGIDIHTQTASQIFKVDVSKVTSEMRRKAKAVNFGILYGISSFGLSEDLQINLSEAKMFIDDYLKTFPGIEKFRQSLIKDAYQNGYVKTMMNRKRYIDELNNKNYIIRQSGERIALNTPIQGSAADIIKKAMIEIDREMLKLNLKSKMLVQVHDELVFEVEKEEEDILKNLVINIMENTYKLNVPLEVDYNIGVNWYYAK